MSLSSAPHFSSPPLGGSGRVELARVGYFPFPKSVKPWLASLFLGQDLLRTECSDVFQNGSLSPPPARAGWDFPLISHEKLHKLLEAEHLGE